MFVLTQKEFQTFRSQIVTEKKGGTRYLPAAFTEQGVEMLSSVLNSEKAIEVNIAIIHTFVLIRQYYLNFDELNKKIKQLEKKYNKILKKYLKRLITLFQKSNRR
ncbi:MAG: ORF6N domain-containing protein [Ferruginibacter sp.]